MLLTIQALQTYRPFLGTILCFFSSLFSVASTWSTASPNPSPSPSLPTHTRSTRPGKLQLVTSKHKLQDQEPWQQEVINNHDAAEENLKDTIGPRQSIIYSSIINSATI